MRVKNIATTLLGVWVFIFILFTIRGAYSQPNQDCVYINNVSYNSSGQIIDAKQTYECKTPQVEKIVEVEKVVYVENQPRYYYNGIEEKPVTTEDIVAGFAMLSLLFGKN